MDAEIVFIQDVEVVEAAMTVLAFLYTSFENEIGEMGGLELLVHLLGQEHAAPVRRSANKALHTIMRERPTVGYPLSEAGVFVALLDLWESVPDARLSVASTLSLFANEAYTKDLIRGHGFIPRIVSFFGSLSISEPGAADSAYLMVNLLAALGRGSSRNHAEIVRTGGFQLMGAAVSKLFLTPPPEVLAANPTLNL